jgi:hypothetical protein
MKPAYNIGNYLPFFEARRTWQHRFQAKPGPSQISLKDWAIKYPKNSVPSFQVMYDGGAPSVVSWQLLNLDGTLAATLDETALVEDCYLEGYQAFTWNGAAICDLDVECGYYYMKLEFDGNPFFSEVFKLVEWPDLNKITLEVTNCAIVSSGGPNYPRWTIEATDCLSATAISKNITIVNDAAEQSGDSIVYDDTGNTGSLTIQRRIETQFGTIVVTYALSYGTSDPCGTYIFTK